MKLPDSWKENRLKDIAILKTAKNKDLKYTETYTNSATLGIVRQMDYFDKEISNKENIAGYYIVEEGDYVYNPRISASAPCGPIRKSHIKETGIMSPLYTVFKITEKNLSDDYLEQYFKSTFWHSYMKTVANYGARYDRMNITTEDFFNIPIPFPPLAEQQKIADILCEQDKIISLKQKLLEQKQKQKKWLMQKLLEVSYAGADVEEKFSLGDVVIDKSGWKKERLESIFFEVNERNHPNESVLTIVQGYGTDYRSNVDRRINYDKANVTSYKAVQEGDFIIHLRSFEGGLEMANQNGIVSPAYIILRLKKNLYNIFLYFLFHSHEFIYRTIAKSVEGIRDGRSVKYESLKKQEIYLPTLPEQKIIAQVLSTADKEIALIKSSIEQEKQKKKSLAQLLLTGIVRVKI